MKKLLGIMVLGLVLTFSSNGMSGEMNVFKKKIKLPPDVMQGYKNAWKFCCNYDPETRLTPDYAFKIVNKSDGHPVRLGEQSIRFEIRRGDCGLGESGWNDCKTGGVHGDVGSERHELSMMKHLSNFKGVTWHTYSLYLPNDFPIHGFNHITMGQFHSDGDGHPAFNWSVGNNWSVGDKGYELSRRTACNLPRYKKFRKKETSNCSLSWPSNKIQTVIQPKDLLGQWHDMVFNVKWSLKQNGYFKQWINGKLVYHYQGSNLTPGEKEGFNFGIYREPRKNAPKEVTQVAYYDEIRYAKKSCKKLKLEDLGYSCADLEKQTIDSIDTIGTDCLENNLCTNQDLKIHRIKHVLSERIANKITEAINSSDIETITTWAFQYLNSLDWDQDLDKIKDRRKTQEKIIKDGIKKFAI